MKHLDEFRNKEYVRTLISQINKVCKKLKNEIRLMEVCGTHTMAIARYGLKKLLPENIRLISGPGCPVCVSPDSYIDIAIEISKIYDVRIVTFGDMFRVPSGNGSLEKQSAEGAKVDIVYSPVDVLEIAKKNSEERIVFLGVGFETTAPVVGKVIMYAKQQGIKNFTVLSGHKLIPPAMETLVNDKNHKIDGFICPGHVSTIIGSAPYNVFPEKYHIPCVISGFEPCDILHSILILLKMLTGEKKVSVEIQYSRCVEKNGNVLALKVISEVFDIVDSEWRGIGIIKASGLAIKEKFKSFDAAKQFKVKIKKSYSRKDCICGLVLKGLKEPFECKLFAKKCNPEKPVGPCMVSSEGACAAYYAYER